MDIIPVIDLKDGVVVSAQRGQRESYQPIKSIFCSSCSIKDVLNGFLSIYPFSIIYIADLDSISNTGNNDQLINSVTSKYKEIEFWVDSGEKIQNLDTIKSRNYRQVMGTESQDEKNIPTFFASNKKEFILSLDFFLNQKYVGPTELFENSNLWPQDIIIMTLERVGSNSGPDFEKLNDFCRKHPEKNFIAAGGIRNQNDLLRLKEIGISHALIASALHSGDIDSEVIKLI
jgi:phosphoribosylformimino-5-aminoimidazole carboxamide ribotide isomerase